MSQYALPIASDLEEGLWTPTPIWRQVNGSGGVVTSGPGPQGDTFEVPLAAIAWPDCGPQILTVRMQKTQPGPMHAAVALLQGNTPIAAQLFTLTQGFADYTITLTDAQAASISDYTQLRVLVTAGDPVVPCCATSVPAVLYATLSGALGGTYPLTYDAGQTAWVGGGAAGGGTVRLLLGCVGAACAAFHLDITCNGSTAGTLTTVACSCDPFSLSMNGFISSTCATGSLSATVTA